MIDMDKFKIGVSGLTHQIYLYRMGKDPQFALDKRVIESEVFAAVIEYLLEGKLDDIGLKKGQSMRFGDKYFRVIAEAITEEAFISERRER